MIDGHHKSPDVICVNDENLWVFFCSLKPSPWRSLVAFAKPGRVHVSLPRAHSIAIFIQEELVLILTDRQNAGQSSRRKDSVHPGANAAVPFVEHTDLRTAFDISNSISELLLSHPRS